MNTSSPSIDDQARIKLLSDWSEVVSICDSAYSTGFYAPSVFSHPGVIRTWIEVFAPRYRARSRTLLFEWGEPSTHKRWALVPMARYRNTWRTRLLPVASSVGRYEFDYFAPLFSSHTECNALRVSLRHIRRILNRRLAPTADVVIARPQPEMFFSGRREKGEASYFIPRRTHSGEDAGFLPGRQLKKLKRKARRLEQETGAEYCAIEDRGDRDELLYQFVELRRRRWPNAHEPLDWFQKLLTAKDTKELVRFRAFVVGNVMIAGHFGFLYDRRFYAYVSVFAEEYGSYSPGMALRGKLFEEFAREADEYDLMRGSEAYKLEFPVTERQLVNVQC